MYESLTNVVHVRTGHKDTSGFNMIDLLSCYDWAFDAMIAYVSPFASPLFPHPVNARLPPVCQLCLFRDMVFGCTYMVDNARYSKKCSCKIFTNCFVLGWAAAAAAVEDCFCSYVTCVDGRDQVTIWHPSACQVRQIMFSISVEKRLATIMQIIQQLCF